MFEVDVDNRELLRSGVRQKLAPQAFQLLSALLERPGELVTHDELRRRLWPDSTFVDHQLGLKKCVNRIRDVFGDSADHPCYLETVPRRGYRFIAPIEQVDGFKPDTRADAGAPVIRFAGVRSPTFRRIFLASVSVLVLTAIAASLVWRSKEGTSAAHTARPAEPVVLPLIGLPGDQSMPAFSPDNSRVAFAWHAPDRRESGIYAVVVGTQSLLRLTENGDDYSPTWSPDGRELAFLRDDAGTFHIEVVPALGGAPKTIYSGTLGPLRDLVANVGLSFSPDRNFLAFSEWNAAIRQPSIKILSLQDSSARSLALPPNGFGDLHPAFSPRGDKLAFVRSTGPALVDDLFVISTAGGEPKQLTFDHKRIFGPPAWSPNGEEIIFSSTRAGLEILWRISASGGVPQRITSAGPFAQYPSVSASSNELAYEHVDEEQNLWRIELKRDTHARGPASILVPSANTYNLVPQFSPDGRKIAFQSSRSGHAQIWICDADGTHLAQLTGLPGFAGTPRWSPDGRYIAFDYRPRQHSEIYVVGLSDLRPRSIAAFSDADNVIPSWSRDGKWIYFASNHGRNFQIWKAAINDGAPAPTPPLQVTNNGGYAAFESADGRQLFYTKPAQPGIWAMTYGEGSERILMRGPGPDYWSNWTVARDGIYFMAPQADAHPEIRFVNFKTKQVSTLAKLENQSYFGLTISPDEHSIVYSQWDRNEHDILIIRNFR